MKNLTLDWTVFGYYGGEISYKGNEAFYHWYITDDYGNAVESVNLRFFIE